jgi:hypothetical protein
MKHQQFRNAGLLLVGVMSVGAVQAQSATAPADAPIPSISDWSSRSLIQGKPMFPEEFVAEGRGAEMEKRYRDPRYVAGVLRRLEAEMPLAAAMKQRNVPQANTAATAKCDPRRDRKRCDDTPVPGDGNAEGLVHRDWSNILGNGNAGTGALGMYPAKYTFDIFATPSCTADFVVYGTNAASASQSAGGAAETRPSTMTGASGDPVGTITIGSAPREVILTASATPSGNLQFLNTGTNAQQAAQLAAAVNVWAHQTGITASAGGSNVNFARLGTGDSDAIAITDNLSNYNVQAAVAGDGISGQPSILAFNQLYNTTCNSGRINTNAPNVMWAYNTGINYRVETSPVLSYYDDGRQVAYIQRNGNTLQLVLLKWQSGQGTATAPVVPTQSPDAAAYRACASNCYFPITLNGTSNTGNGPTYSSPYVDYANDILWVGDGNSRLHKFTGVFRGNPAEVTTGFPVSVTNAGLDLSPPVADDNFVYIGSQSGAGANDGGRVHRVPVAGGTVVSSAKLYANSRNGFRAPMILDTGFNRLNTFAFSVPGTPTSNTLCQHQGNPYVYCRAVIQFDTTNFTAGTSGTKREVGLGSITGENVALWMGAFDDAYYTSGTGTGAMYICGGSLPRTQRTHLWKVPFTNGVMGVPVIGAQIVQDDNETDTTIYNCSPPTYVKNGSNEYLYVSTSGAGTVFSNNPGCGAAADAASACMFMFQLNNLDGDGTPNEVGDTTWGTTNLPRAALLVPGGTGGIIVDNVGNSTTGAQQIYTTNAGTTGNAVQASQSGLQ